MINRKKSKKYIFIILLLSIILLAIIFPIFLTNKKIRLDSNYNELFTREEFNTKGHFKVLPEFSTEVSKAFSNNDGTKTLYVYSSTINYKNKDNKLPLIDTRIVNTKESEYSNNGYKYSIANSDIKSYYPKELSSKKGVVLLKNTSYEFGVNLHKPIPSRYDSKNNFINEKKDMIIYKNACGNSTELRIYPSSFGTNCEIYFSKKPKNSNLSFWLKISDKKIFVRKEPGGYIILYNNNIDKDGNQKEEIYGVIQPPLLKDKIGNVSYNNEVDFKEKEDGNIEIIFKFDKNFINKNYTAFISFEMRREKQPDNAIYSNRPELTNAYLNNYSVIGNSTDFGIGRMLIRFKFTKNFNLKSSQIKEAYYYVYNLSKVKKNNKLELLSVLEDWCSLTGNWSYNYKTGERTTYLKSTNGELKFNITEEVKKWCDDKDGQMEHNGVELKITDEEVGIWNIILSNDNSLYRTKTEIILK